MIKNLFNLWALILISVSVHAQTVNKLDDWRIYQGVIYDNSVYLSQADSALPTTAQYKYSPSLMPVPASQQPNVIRIGRSAIIRWSRTVGLPAEGIVEIYAGTMLRYTVNVLSGRTPAFAVNARLPSQLSAFTNDVDYTTNAIVRGWLAAKFNSEDTIGFVRKRTGKDLSSNDFTTALLTKLLGLQAGATANSTDAYLLDRRNHTNKMSASAIADFVASVRASLSATGSNVRYDTLTGKFAFTVPPPTTSAADLATGKLDDARLSTNVLLSTLTYSNPAWLLSLSAAKITDLATVARTGAYGDLIGQPTLGTLAAQNANAVLITGGRVSLSGFDAYNSQLRVGSLEIQGYSADESYIMHNASVDENGVKRRVLGAAGMWMFKGNEGQYRFANSGFGYSTPLATRVEMKINAAGDWGVGAAMPPELGDFTGAAIRAFGASGNIAIGTTVDDPNGALNISSDKKGILLPSLTSAQINAITIPTKRMLLFNNDLGVFQYWNGTQWKTLQTN